MACRRWTDLTNFERLRFFLAMLGMALRERQPEGRMESLRREIGYYAGRVAAGHADTVAGTPWAVH